MCLHVGSACDDAAATAPARVKVHAHVVVGSHYMPGSPPAGSCAWRGPATAVAAAVKHHLGQVHSDVVSPCVRSTAAAAVYHAACSAAWAASTSWPGTSLPAAAAAAAAACCLRRSVLRLQRSAGRACIHTCCIPTAMEQSHHIDDASGAAAGVGASSGTNVPHHLALKQPGAVGAPALRWLVRLLRGVAPLTASYFLMRLLTMLHSSAVLFRPCWLQLLRQS
jgi:hypothetical protein